LGRIAVITDSTCCLPSELVDKYDICVVPLVIIHKGNSYYDGIDISPSEVYKIMRRRKELPTTSTPSAGDFLNAYRKLSEGADGMVAEQDLRSRGDGQGEGWGGNPGRTHRGG